MRIVLCFLMLLPFLTGWMPKLGHPQKEEEVTRQACLATGAFSLNKAQDRLSMQVMCVREVGGRTEVVQVQDWTGQKTGDNFFRIPFAQSVVGLAKEAGELVVRVHYRPGGDKEAKIEERILASRDGESYPYSFEGLVPDTIEPELLRVP